MDRQIVLYEDLEKGLKYQQVWELQEQLLAATIKIKKELNTLNPFERPTKHHLLLVEHHPVFTLGKSGQIEHLFLSEAELQAKEIEYFRINRGGDITFHGPGQLVGYPILDLEKFQTDIGKYLRNLEEVIIKVLAHFGLKGQRSVGETGVWLDPDVPGKERKICAMGVRCSRWVTMHGWALNVNTDLNYFSYIVPCGIANKKVTSLQKEMGVEIDFNLVKNLTLSAFSEVFDVQLLAS